jgi:hypothetical protein
MENIYEKQKKIGKLKMHKLLLVWKLENNLHAAFIFSVLNSMSITLRETLFIELSLACQSMTIADLTSKISHWDQEKSNCLYDFAVVNNAEMRKVYLIHFSELWSKPKEDRLYVKWNLIASNQQRENLSDKCNYKKLYNITILSDT